MMSYGDTLMGEMEFSLRISNYIIQLFITLFQLRFTPQKFLNLQLTSQIGREVKPGNRFGRGMKDEIEYDEQSCPYMFRILLILHIFHCFNYVLNSILVTTQSLNILTDSAIRKTKNCAFMASLLKYTIIRYIHQHLSAYHKFSVICMWGSQKNEILMP